MSSIGVKMGNNNEIVLWDLLQMKSKNIEDKMDLLYRKRTGSYYTDLQLTDMMMEELVVQLKKEEKRIVDYRFLEPCVGIGNFVFSYIKAVYNLGINRMDAETLLKNIYVSDINESALVVYKESLKEIALLFWNIELKDSYFDEHVGSGLLIDVTANSLKYIGLDRIFPDVVGKGGFDIIATNPPYRKLKAEKKDYSCEEEYKKDKNKYFRISELVSENFLYSNGGVLNLYKLFVEEIIDRYANKNAYISLLIPSSIISDKTTKNLRTHMLLDMNLISVKIFDEGCKYIDAQQALTAILLKKGAKTTSIQLTKYYHDAPNSITNVNVDDIINENTGNAIFAVNQEEYAILKKLRTFPVIKELDFITNLRGELDLTINKHYIISQNTDYSLLRGRDIGLYSLRSNDRAEFISSSFLHVTKKKEYIENDRIACQQVANMNKERRITFSYIPKNFILANSCNFLSISKNQYKIDIFALLGLLNTRIVNWFFKLTSSNNHVNNYEIDCFPIPIESKELPVISKLVRKYLKTGNEKIIADIEHLAEVAYGINEKRMDLKLENKEYLLRYLKDISYFLPEVDINIALKILKEKIKIEDYYIGLDRFTRNVIKGITDKYRALYHGYLLNHTTFKLSELDLEMIRTVPQGGNWKNIPMETVEKSKRLRRITETGGRTTLYGRIDYMKPSYTITTYFNRPGNGTYIHPIHNRVLSVREAARFQTFKDEYYFFGNKSQVLKQVGNAVPTLLAYQIGKRIKDILGCSKSIDLFCGAGGMTAGFKAAGILSVMSNDIEESACTTLKINNPEIEVLCGDITKNEIRDTLEQVAKKRNADIICGGPPCQGFSMAGFRDNDDARNQLFREFVDIVKRVRPKVIVFENVEGLLSYQGGKTYNEVHELFSSLGYKTEGRTLIATDYGIPQKRKRVIIICTRNDLNVNPTDLFPIPITFNESDIISAYQTISDLEDVDCGEEARYIQTTESMIIKFFKNKISYEDYVKQYIKQNGLYEITHKMKQMSLFDSIQN